MAACAVVDQSGAIVLANPQPGSMADCQAFVALTPTEFSQASQVPDPAEASAFFGFGFFMVVASYLGGWAVGSVLKVVRQGH